MPHPPVTHPPVLKWLAHFAIVVLTAAQGGLVCWGQAGDTDSAEGIRRVELLPEPDHQVSLRTDGVEKLRWHFGRQYPRPFFYPFSGPSGVSLTRMGHPGAANHDHHRSVWFAHSKVEGTDFWSDRTRARIRQKHWYHYRDGEEEGILAAALGWHDEEGAELLHQDLVAALLPLENDEWALEFQLTFRCGGGRERVELEQTNFGFLAVRVSKTLSAHFGGGTLTNSEGAVGEEAIFGQRAAWMDYSGPVVVGQGKTRHTVTEGITYFDHPDNPRHPTRWHVREDGWMGASFCMDESYLITAAQPLVLRYLLHAHRGASDAARAEEVHRQFARREGFVIEKSAQRHQQYEVRRQQ